VDLVAVGVTGQGRDPRVDRAAQAGDGVGGPKRPRRVTPPVAFDVTSIVHREEVDLVVAAGGAGHGRDPRVERAAQAGDGVGRPNRPRRVAPPVAFAVTRLVPRAD